MQSKNDNLMDVDALMDAKFGKEGTPQREEFRKKAYAYYVGQIIRDARKEEKISQEELAKKVGTNKSYVSRIEHGLIEPTIGTFYRIIDALGMKVEIVRPVE